MDHYRICTHEGWLRAQTEYKFAFSPPGNGIDCHQTWEMLLLSAIPIMQRTIIDLVFEELQATGTVLIVDDWKEVKQALLGSHWYKYGSFVQGEKSWDNEQDDNVILAKYWVRKFIMIGGKIDPKVDWSKRRSARFCISKC